MHSVADFGVFRCVLVLVWLFPANTHGIHSVSSVGSWLAIRLRYWTANASSLVINIRDRSPIFHKKIAQKQNLAK